MIADCDLLKIIEVKELSQTMRDALRLLNKELKRIKFTNI